MVPTLEFVTERFNHFNALIFNPALPPINIKIGTARRTLGSFAHPRKLRIGQKRTEALCTITISRAYDREPAEIEDTIIHEMIHYMVWLNGTEEPAHGPTFQKAMRDINHAFHRNISIRNHDELDANDSVAPLRIILTIKMADGTIGFACVARTRVLEFEKILNQNKIPHEWRVTRDGFFNRYRVFRTLKYYRISPSDYQAHIAPAQLLKL